MVNKVILVGNVGQDPDIRLSQNGGKIGNFSLATTESWKDKSTGERKSVTQWHRVVVFNENIANVVENYVKKGSKLFVEGALQSRKYTGNDGIERNISEVVITQFRGELQLLDSRNSEFSKENYPNNSSEATSETSNKNAKSFEDIGEDLDDEIPF